MNNSTEQKKMYFDTPLPNTIEGIKYSMETSAKETGINMISDVQSMSNDIYAKIEEEIDDMTYLELKELDRQLKSEIKSIKNAIGIANSALVMANSFGALGSDALMAKMSLANLIGDKSIDDFKEKGDILIRELDKSLNLVTETLNSQYKDTVVTSKFFTSQMVLSIGRKIKHIKENDKNVDEDTKKEAIELLLKQSVIYNNRDHLWDNVNEFLLKPYGRLIRKSKQFCRNLPDSAYDNTKKSLSHAFDEKRMAAMEYTIIKYWNNPNTIVPFFTFLSMIIERSNSSTEFTIAHTFITVMIMNACDMVSKIWDYDVSEEEYSEGLKKLEDVFTIVK